MLVDKHTDQTDNCISAFLLLQYMRAMIGRYNIVASIMYGTDRFFLVSVFLFSSLQAPSRYEDAA